MRYVSEMTLAAALALGGCSDSDNPISRPVVDDPNDHIQAFDYLGPLWASAVSVNYGSTDYLPTLVSCSGGTTDHPFASCIEAVTLDGVAADEADLKMGQIVEAHGTRVGPFSWAPESPRLNDRPGVTIDIQRAIVGPVEDIDPDRGWLTVLGQRVYTYDAPTVDVAIGDTIVVHGYFTVDGQVLAQLIEPYVGDLLFLVRGVLTESAPGRLVIGALEVDLSSAARENFPAGAPLPGDTVLVLADQPPDQGLLTARTVRCTGECVSGPWESGYVRGFLTAWRSSTDFDVAGIAIRPTGCDCAYAVPPAIGSFVDVAVVGGYAEVGLGRSTSHRTSLAGQISAIDAALREIVVLGYRVQVPPVTYVTSDPGSEPWFAQPFDALHVGDTVTILGEVLGSGVIASRIVLRPADEFFFVRTLDYTLDEPFIEFAGQPILIDATTQVILCENDGGFSFEEFFGTAWFEQSAAFSIAVDTSSTPLVASMVTICTPGYYEWEDWFR